MFDSFTRLRSLTYCSGVLVLQQHYWQVKLKTTLEVTEEIFPETQSAVDTLDRISTSLRGGGDALRALGDARCTVLFVDLVYKALLVLLTIGASQAIIGFENKKESLKWLLSHLSKRWPLAGRSLSCTEGKRGEKGYALTHTTGVYETIIQSKEAALVVSGI